LRIEDERKVRRLKRPLKKGFCQYSLEKLEINEKEREERSYMYVKGDLSVLAPEQTLKHSRHSLRTAAGGN